MALTYAPASRSAARTTPLKPAADQTRMACRSPAAEGPYRVILKVSYGLTFAHASYHDGRWHGLRDHAAVVGFVPASLPTEGATP